MTMLVSGNPVRVRLAKPIHRDVEYDAEVISDDGTHIVVRGPWAEAEARDLGFVRFEPGDLFTEHYWRDRWYSIKEVRDERGVLKGWYCDVARPVRIEHGLLISEDLDLDLWVSADAQTILRLDEDEFAASGLGETDPVAVTRAVDALGELERMAIDGFVSIDSDTAVKISQPTDLATHWPEIARLLRAVHDYHQPLLGFELLDDWAERQRAFFDPANPGVLLIVASIGNRLVGLLNGRLARNASIFRETVLVIDNMYVEPARRRTGIGRQLLDSASEWGRSEGATEVRLMVVQGNTTAERFYEAEGFETRMQLLTRKL